MDYLRTKYSFLKSYIVKARLSCFLRPCQSFPTRDECLLNVTELYVCHEGGGCGRGEGLVWSEGNAHHPQLPRGTLKTRTWDDSSGLMKLTTGGWGVFCFRWSTCNLYWRPITTAWGHWLANDRQPRINWSGEVREPAVTKAIVEEAEWTVNETLDPKW